MTDLLPLLSDCYVQGIHLAIAGDGGLAIDAPRGLLTPKRLDVLKAHKGELIAHLQEESQCLDSQQHEWEDTLERDGKTRRFCLRCCKFGGFVQPDKSVVPPEPILPCRFDGASTFCCPWCHGTRLIPGTKELWCDDCSQLAWLDLPTGGIVRADQQDFEKVTLVPCKCGSYELWESAKTGAIRCMKCDPALKTFEDLKAQAVELRPQGE